MTTDPRIAERFWAKVDRRGDDECWPWTASRTYQGYGQFFPAKRTFVRAHRFAYEAAIGPIPAGLTIDHLCRNKACVNPAHMEPVTAIENGLRGNLGLVHAVCRNGLHEMSGANVALWGGRRYCVSCSRAKDAAALHVGPRRKASRV